jgi:hypothetical protein
MVAELVREYARQFLVGEVSGGVRRHDEEMSAAREGIEVVGVDDCEDESLARDSVCLGDDVPGSAQSHELVRIRPSSSEHARKDRPLHWAKEQTRTAEKRKDCENHEWNSCRLIHGNPDDANRDEPHGEERNDRCERGECREIDFAALCGHSIIQPARPRVLWSRF